MKIKPHNAPDAPQPSGGYAQAVELSGHERVLFISGQIPETSEGTAPAEFDGQCRRVWANIEAQLDAAGMDFSNLVKVTTFLSSREHRADNSRIRSEIIGDRPIALTVVICDIYDVDWLLEIEAIAAA